MSIEDEIILYTDGACSGNPGPGGWACILVHHTTETIRKLADGVENTTNNRMELMAVIKGLDSLKRPCRVRVVSDSQYVIRGMSEWVHQWIKNDWRRGPRKSQPVKNIDLWKTLVDLCNRHEVTFEHVPAHSGHSANEECDRMAVAATKALKNGKWKMEN
ncbi:MAG: ribonuclease HI [Phycisphaerae bacterium]|nr:ribonuclease HI [Phycisphaerae bacterium]